MNYCQKDVPQRAQSLQKTGKVLAICTEHVTQPLPSQVFNLQKGKVHPHMIYHPHMINYSCALHSRDRGVPTVGHYRTGNTHTPQTRRKTFIQCGPTCMTLSKLSPSTAIEKLAALSISNREVSSSLSRGTVGMGKERTCLDSGADCTVCMSPPHNI